MSDTIYYVYRKDTGAYAGSGITQIDDATYGSTTTPSPDEPEAARLWRDGDTGEWAWWMPVVQQDAGP